MEENMNSSCDLSLQSTLSEETSVNLNDNVDVSHLDISEEEQNTDSIATGCVELCRFDSKMSITLSDDELEFVKGKKNSFAKSSEEKEHFSTAKLQSKDMSMNISIPQVNLEIGNGTNCSADFGSETPALNMPSKSIIEDDELKEMSFANGTTSSFNVNDLSNLDSRQIKSTLECAPNVESYEHTVAFADNELSKNPFVEVGRRLWKSEGGTQRYTKGCLWSPDGTCLLVPVHMDGMHVVELPMDLYSNTAVDTLRPVSGLTSAVHVMEGGTVYDFAWYPFMSSEMPETCCWLATRQHEPIHLWDAFNGQLRCSFRGIDDVDEVEAAISVIFSNDGTKVIGGYKKNIKIFDTNQPGRNFTSIKVKKTVSCFALPSDNDSTITTGCWNGYVYHYDLRSPQVGPLFTLAGHKGGITMLRYMDNGGNLMLFSGARKDNKILQWDMRNYKVPVYEFHRNVDTNQRIFFDVSPSQQWLISGDTNGLLRIWDLYDECDPSKEFGKIPLHGDCCNGVNFHPSRPILATSSGQYHFLDPPLEEETAPMPEIGSDAVVEYENAVLLLWYGKNIVT